MKLTILYSDPASDGSMPSDALQKDVMHKASDGSKPSDARVALCNMYLA